MTSSYDDVYTKFLGKIRDVEFANFTEADAREYMREWLRSSLARPYIRRLFDTISLDDEIATMTYELKLPTDEEQDIDFVCEILAYQMIVQWLEPKIQSTTLLNQMISNSKEMKFYSQSSHLTAMRTLYENAQITVRNIIRDRGYIYNTYLGVK